MSDETILAGIREILEDMEAHSGGERIQLSRDVHLVRDLDLDSLKRIELVIRIENEFRVQLEPEDEEEITTLGDLVDVVRRRRA
jgi:acyl carrier protein